MSDGVVALEGSIKHASPQLPPEILCLVFEALARIAPIVESYFRYQRKIGWLVATMVCQSWRNAAIDHQALWANITVASPRLFRMFLARAGHLTLSISAPTGDLVHEYISLILEHIGRVNTLNVGASPMSSSGFSRLFNGLNLNMDADLSSLKTLTLRRYYVDPSDVLSPQFFERSVNLCDVQLGNLQHFSWGFSHFNLRSLCVANASGNTPHIEINTLLDGLRGLVALECLDLDYIVRSSEATLPMVKLAHLKSLTLRSLTAAKLLSIEMHPEAAAHIAHQKLVGTIPWNYAPLAEYVHTYFARGRAPVAVSICVGVSPSYVPGPPSVEVNATFLTGQPSTTIRLPSRAVSVIPGFSMSVYFRNSPDAHMLDDHEQTPPEQLPLAFSVGSWTSLFFCCSVRPFPYRLWDMLRAADNLQELTLLRIHHSEFVQSVRAFLPNEATLLPFPRLRTVALKETAFDCPCKGCKGDGSLTAAVEVTLRERERSGHRQIQHLYIRKCTGIIESVHVRKWSMEFGCAIHWDGKGRAETSHGYGED